MWKKRLQSNSDLWESLFCGEPRSFPFPIKMLILSYRHIHKQLIGSCAIAWWCTLLFVAGACTPQYPPPKNVALACRTINIDTMETIIKSLKSIMAAMCPTAKYHLDIVDGDHEAVVFDDDSKNFDAMVAIREFLTPHGDCIGIIDGQNLPIVKAPSNTPLLLTFGREDSALPVGYSLINVWYITKNERVHFVEKTVVHCGEGEVLRICCYRRADLADSTNNKSPASSAQSSLSSNEQSSHEDSISNSSQIIIPFLDQQRPEFAIVMPGLPRDYLDAKTNQNIVDSWSFSKGILKAFMLLSILYILLIKYGFLWWKADELDSPYFGPEYFG